jgi:hypothetical protein
MKTTLVSLLTATLLGFAAFVTGRSIDAANFVAIAFALGLAAWTLEQYSRTPRPLTRARPIHLPVTPDAGHPVNQARQLAA